MTDGTTQKNQVEEVFEVYDVAMQPSLESAPIMFIDGNRVQVAFPKLLMDLRDKHGLQQRPLIGPKDAKGRASIEERTFGLYEKDQGYYFLKGGYSEITSSLPQSITKRTELGEALIAYDAFLHAISTPEKVNENIHNEYLKFLLEIGDIWWQQQVFAFDKDELSADMNTDELKHLAEVEGYFKIIDTLLDKAKELIVDHPDQANLALLANTDTIQSITMQKYYIRSIMHKTGNEEQVVIEACKKLLGLIQS